MFFEIEHQVCVIVFFVRTVSYLGLSGYWDNHRADSLLSSWPGYLVLK